MPPVTADADGDAANGHQVVLVGPSAAITITATPRNGVAQSYVVTISGITEHNYDDEGDGLIDVRTLAHLNAIRYDLDGNGVSAPGSAAVNYAAAFPGLTAGMGCPDGCAGYELRQNPDFDTTSNDNVADAPYANWSPIGTISAPYAGNSTATTIPSPT